MSKTAKIIPINNNLSFVDKKTGETKSTYDKINHNLVYVPRADNPNKCLSQEAGILVSNYYNMIKDNPNGIIFVTHDFISSKTRVGISQNKRYHNELRDLFDIQYHKSVIIGGKKHRDGFTINFTENAEIILKNPKLFYSSQKEKKEQLNVQKRTVKRSKKNAPLYIDKKENNNKKYSYIANENLNNKKQPEEKKSNEASQANSLNKKFILKDFYPLSQEDTSNLQVLSGRSFELLPMNEILVKIHNYTVAKGVSIEFNDKDHFLNYFAKRLSTEKRDAYKINNLTFRINANITPEEKETKERNKYLEEKEKSGNAFEKFIASSLSERKAYDFLRAFRSLDTEGDTAKIFLDRHVKLGENDLKFILQEIRHRFSTSGQSKKSIGEAIAQMVNPQDGQEKKTIEKIELITKNSTKRAKEMSNINQQILDSFGSVRGQEILKICNIIPKSDDTIQVEVKTGELLEENDKCLLRQCIKTVYGEVKISTNQPKLEAKIIHLDQRNDTNWPLWETKADLWEKFKKGILEQLRTSEGEHIFKAWFDKLEQSQDISANKLTLTGKEFLISYISQNYSRLIENTVKSKKINVTLVYEGREDPGYRPIVFTPTEGRKF